MRKQKLEMYLAYGVVILILYPFSKAAGWIYQHYIGKAPSDD